MVNKPTENNINLKEKIIANKEHKQQRILKKEGIDQENIIEGKEIEFKELFKRFL